MSQSEKSAYYKALQDAGVEFDRHYREYSTKELKDAYLKLVESQPPPEPRVDAPSPAPTQPDPFHQIPVAARDPHEMAGQRQNTHADGEPIRIDENGVVWYQEEVRKPAFPKPRGRRVLTYMETGVKQQVTTNGNYTETFEVAGDDPGRPAEVKITLPSFQVGIYRDPRFPFKIHEYNEKQGFDLFEVQEYYGGAELVPTEIKRIYVEQVLCYDIRTVVRAIETEYRQMQLAGKAK